MDYPKYFIHRADYQDMLEMLAQCTTFADVVWHHSPAGSEMEQEALKVRTRMREMWETLTRRALERVAVAGALTMPIAPPTDQPA